MRKYTTSASVNVSLSMVSLHTMAVLAIVQLKVVAVDAFLVTVTIRMFPAPGAVVAVHRRSRMLIVFPLVAITERTVVAVRAVPK